MKSSPTNNHVIALDRSHLGSQFSVEALLLELGIGSDHSREPTLTMEYASSQHSSGTSASIAMSEPASLSDASLIAYVQLAFDTPLAVIQAENRESEAASRYVVWPILQVLIMYL